MQFDIVANDKATPTMAQVEKSMGKFASTVGSKFSLIAARATAIIATVQQVAATLNELGKASDDAARLGMTVEQYTKLKFAAEQYGSSIEEIAKAQKDANKLMDEAATKGASSDQFKTLQALGFSDQDILNRNIKVAEVFERIGEAIKGAGSEQEKFALASRVFGDKISQSMIPVLENYREFNLAQGTAASMSQKSADALDRAGESMNGFFNAIKQGAGELLGRAINAVSTPEPKLAVPVTPSATAENQKRREDLLKIGATAADKATKQAGEVSSMAAIGGASARGLSAMGAKPIEEQQLDALNKIADNTAPGGSPVPQPGMNDMTKGDSSYAAVTERIRASGYTRPNNLERYRSMRPSR